MTSQRHSQRGLNTVFTTAHNAGNGGSQPLSTYTYTLKGICAARYGAGAACDLVPMPGEFRWGGLAERGFLLSLAGGQS